MPASIDHFVPIAGLRLQAERGGARLVRVGALHYQEIPRTSSITIGETVTEYLNINLRHPERRRVNKTEVQILLPHAPIRLPAGGAPRLRYSNAPRRLHEQTPVS